MVELWLGWGFDNSTLSFGEQTLTLDWKGKRLCLPINQENSGHFHLQFFPTSQVKENHFTKEVVPMSQVEENHFTKEMVSKADQHGKEIETAIIQVAREKKPRTEKTKRPEMLKTHKKPLGKQQVIHPHQSSDHIFSEKVKGSARRKNMRNNNTVNAIDDLNRPKTCAVGCIEIPNAKEAEPQTFGHNHIQASVAETDPALRKTLQ